MPSISQNAHIQDVPLRLLDGRRFNGRVIPIGENTPTSVIPAKRALRVHPNGLPKAGDILLFKRRKYLLAQGPENTEGNISLDKLFRLIELDRVYSWQRKSKVIDATTKLERDAGLTSLGTIMCNLEPREERMDRSSKLTNMYEKWRLYTNSEVKIDDLIDGRMVISRVEQISGIYQVELS